MTNQIKSNHTLQNKKLNLVFQKNIKKYEIKSSFHNQKTVHVCNSDSDSDSEFDSEFDYIHYLYLNENCQNHYHDKRNEELYLH